MTHPSSQTPLDRHTRRRNMLVLLATTFAIVCARLTWWQVLPLHLRSLGASDAQVGAAFTGLLLVQGPMHLVGGYVSDRWGRRFAIAWPSLALVLVLAAGAAAAHWLALAVTVWLVGVISGIQQPGLQALVAESGTAADRGRMFGGFYTIVAAANMIGPALGAGLLPAFAIRGLIWLTAGTALIAGLARLFLLQEGQYMVHSGDTLTLPLRDLLSAPWLRRLVLINTLYLLLLSLTHRGPFIALHAADYLAMNERSVNLMFAIGGVGATLTALLGGSLTDHFGGRRSASVALLLHALLLVGWSQVNTGSLLNYLVFGLSWIAVQIGMVSYVTWYAAYAPGAIRGRVLGYVGAVATVASAAGPQLGSWLRSAALEQTRVMPGLAGWASAAPLLWAVVTAILLAALLAPMPTAHATRTDAP